MIEIEVNFRDPASFARNAREGWGNPEPFGSWMTGQLSRLVLPAPPRTDGDFELNAIVGPMVVPGILDSQRLRLLVNRHVVLETTMTGLQTLRCRIPAAVLAARPYIEILFEHPDAASPASLGTGHDVRELAASIWSLLLLGDSPLPAVRDPVAVAPVFFTRSLGNLANRMIQYMVALAVQAQAPDCVLAGIELDEWGIRTRPDDGTWADLALVDEQHIDIAGVAEVLNSGSIYKIAHRGYGQRMENLLPPAAYAGVFTSDEPDILAYDDQHLVMNVRSGDVVSGRFRDYVLTPLAFYRELIEKTGLIPVFVGQLEPNAYTDALREAFPRATFHESQGPVRDFETLRRSKNLVVSVSTFSWLAAFLSDAEQIFLPVNGLFNPQQFPDVDLLPLSDSRYRFYLFPINHAAEDFTSAHDAIEGQWRQVSADELKNLRSTTETATENDAVQPALLVTTHISERGDVIATENGWAGEPRSGLPIEGFSLTCQGNLAASDILYEALLGHSILTTPIAPGGFAGTKGRHLPIRGYRVRLTGASAERLLCECWARFVDGTEIGPIPAGEICATPSLSALEAMRISLKLKN